MSTAQDNPGHPTIQDALSAPDAYAVEWMGKEGGRWYTDKAGFDHDGPVQCAKRVSIDGAIAMARYCNNPLWDDKQLLTAFLTEKSESRIVRAER